MVAGGQSLDVAASPAGSPAARPVGSQNDAERGGWPRVQKAVEDGKVGQRRPGSMYGDPAFRRAMLDGDDGDGRVDSAEIIGAAGEQGQPVRGGGRGDHEVDAPGARVTAAGEGECDESSVAAGGFPVKRDGGECGLDVCEPLGADHDLLGALGHREALGELGQDEGGDGCLDGKPGRIKGRQVDDSAGVEHAALDARGHPRPQGLSSSATLDLGFVSQGLRGHAANAACQRQQLALARVRRVAASMATALKRLELEIAQLDSQSRPGAAAGPDDRLESRDSTTLPADLQQHYSDLHAREERITGASRRLQAELVNFRAAREAVESAYTAAEAAASAAWGEATGTDEATTTA